MLDFRRGTYKDLSGMRCSLCHVHHPEFHHDAADDVHRCRNGAVLRAMQSYKTDVGCKRHIRYVSREPICDPCMLNAYCLTDKAYRRTIYGWETGGVSSIAIACGFRMRTA